jgi:hypothetical protein
VARRKNAQSVSFEVANIAASHGRAYDAVLCRGVLNDIIADDERGAVFRAFAHAVRPGGVLILDARLWETTATRKVKEPMFRKTVDTAGGTLTFTSVTAIEPEGHRLHVAERHVLDRMGQQRISEYRFVMRCWTKNELETQLASHGFQGVRWFGSYEPSTDADVTDRIVALAIRGRG